MSALQQQQPVAAAAAATTVASALTTALAAAPMPPQQQQQLATPRANILDRPLAATTAKGRGEVNASTFLFLFSEVVQYCAGLGDVQQRLADLGHGVGVRFLELLAFRAGRTQRYTDLVDVLRFVSTTVWKTLFGNEADALEKATGSEDTYWISDDNLLVNRFIPKEAAASCAAYVAGIVQGVLDAAQFKVKVTTIRYHSGPAGAAEPKTYIKVVCIK